MGFLDDVLNGGLDRDFDGDIDSRDRDIHFLEEELRKQEKKLHRYQYDDWKDYYLEELSLKESSFLIDWWFCCSCFS